MEPKKSLQKNVWLLSLASVLNDISSEIIAPVLPVLIRNLGGTGLSIGLIAGVREGLTYILKLVFGALSDHQNKRKPFVVLGYFISACFKGILFFAQSWQHILIFVGLERIGKGIRTSPRDVIIAQSTPNSVAKSLGIVRSFDNIGATIGSIIIFLLLWLYKLDLKLIVFLATGIALLSLIPLFFIQEPNQITPEDSHEWGTLPTSVKKFAFINSIFHFGAISYMFLTLRVHDVSSIFSPVQNALLMYTTFNVIHALCAAPFGTIIDSLNHKICVISGYIFYGLVMIGFWIAQTPLQFWLLFMVYGIALAITDTSQRAFAISLSPSRRQGTSVGIVYASMGITQIIGGAACGFIWEYISHGHIFLLSAITTSLSVFLLTTLYSKSDAHAQ